MADKSKKLDDDCDMVTSLQAPALSKAELYLHEAARKNDEKIIKIILQKSLASVDTKNNLDRTALHIAASQGHKNACMELIQCKASPDLADKYGMTPVMWATYFNHKEIVELLMKKNVLLTRRNKQGMHCLHLAAERNHNDLFNFLVKVLRSETNINDVERNGRTVLMIAAAHGSNQIVNNLLQRNECRREMEDKMKKTALHHAAENGHVAVLHLLMDSMLAMKINNIDIDQFKNPLHYASALGHVDVVRLMIASNANVNIETGDEKHQVALHLATLGGHSEIVKQLTEVKDCNVNAKNNHGNTALHLAAISDNATIIEILLSANIEVNSLNDRQQSALHSAVEQNKPNATEALLLAGADLSLVDKTGKTPLILATRGSYIGLVDMIIKAERHRVKNKRLHPTIFQHETHTPATKNHDDSCRPEDFQNVYNIHSEHQSEITDFEHYPQFRLKEFNQEYADEFKLFLWKLAFKHLRHGEWKKLGFYWNFQPDHIAAIEHQMSGEESYKQHGYRILCIWFHGVDRLDTPLRELYSALEAIGRKELAVKMRRDLDKSAVQNVKSCTIH